MKKRLMLAFVCAATFAGGFALVRFNPGVAEANAFCGFKCDALGEISCDGNTYQESGCTSYGASSSDYCSDSSTVVCATPDYPGVDLRSCSTENGCAFGSGDCCGGA